MDYDTELIYCGDFSQRENKRAPRRNTTLSAMNDFRCPKVWFQSGFIRKEPMTSTVFAFSKRVLRLAGRHPKNIEIDRARLPDNTRTLRELHPKMITNYFHRAQYIFKSMASNSDNVAHTRVPRIQDLGLWTQFSEGLSTVWLPCCP